MSHACPITTKKAVDFELLWNASKVEKMTVAVLQYYLGNLALK